MPEQDPLKEFFVDDEEPWTILQKCWPDYFAFKAVVGSELPDCMFVIERSRNYPIQPDRLMLLQMLEKLGLKVRVRLANEGKLLTLEEFATGGVMEKYGTLTKQTMYNYRAEVRNIKRTLQALPAGHPSRDKLTARLTAREALLSKMPDYQPPELGKEVREQEKTDQAMRPFGFTYEAFVGTILPYLHTKMQDGYVPVKIELEWLEWEKKFLPPADQSERELNALTELIEKQPTKEEPNAG